MEVKMAITAGLVLDQTHLTLLHFKKDLELTVKFEYQPEEKGYLGSCPEIDAVVWGETLSQAKEELIDAITDTSNVLLENSSQDDFNRDPRLKYARIIGHNDKLPLCLG
ncbi:MAG: hypothetical protein QME81_09350 [bacterium]|nr:hypothetical protein [bacterium]